MTMYVIVWEYQVKTEHLENFEKFTEKVAHGRIYFNEGLAILEPNYWLIHKTIIVT